MVWAVAGAYLVTYWANMIGYSSRGKLVICDRLLDARRRGGARCRLRPRAACCRRRPAPGHREGHQDGPLVKGAVGGNQPQAILADAAAEGVPDRVQLCQGGARSLPSGTGAFDVVVSNFVVPGSNEEGEGGRRPPVRWSAARKDGLRRGMDDGTLATGARGKRRRRVHGQRPWRLRVWPGRRRGHRRRDRRRGAG
jgi:hypothetical protein